VPVPSLGRASLARPVDSRSNRCAHRTWTYRSQPTTVTGRLTASESLARINLNLPVNSDSESEGLGTSYLKHWHH
jgi:hypothetical protein